MKQTAITIALTLAISGLLAQEPTDGGFSQLVEKTSPVSPQAAEYQKFGSYQIDYSTGVPQIELPLYQIQLGDYTMPISIRYHASGIKVQELSGLVGLGWNLNAGGCISRQVKSGVDSGSVSYYNKNLLEQALRDGHISYEGLADWADNSSPSYNSETDIYSYSFPGHSGTFRYTYPDLNIYPLPYEAIRISEAGSGYRITDEDGNIYNFTRQEQSNQSGQFVFVTGWYLASICPSSSSDSIVFHYGTPIPVFQSVFSDFEDYGERYHLHAQNRIGGIEYSMVSSGSSLLTYPQSIQNNSHILPIDSITWQGNAMRFTYTAEAASYQVGKRISAINVYSMTGEHVRSIQLNVEGRGTQSGGDSRMLLSSLDLVNTANSQSKETYVFTYNSTQLPQYPDAFSNFRCREDHWGYYNSNPGTARWIPREYSYSQHTTYADRSVDATKAKAMVLQTIRYPTGGRTEFEFESNRLDDGTLWGGLRLKRYSSLDQSGNTLLQRSFSYSGACPTVPITAALYRYDVNYVYRLDGTVIDEHTCPHTVYVGNPSIPLSGDKGSPIHYTQVTEYYGSTASNLGYVRYTFENTGMDYAFYMNYMTNAGASAYWYIAHDAEDKGLVHDELLKKESYNSNGTLVCRETNTYQDYPLTASNPWSGVRLRRRQVINNFLWAWTTIDSPIENYRTSYVAVDVKLLPKARLLKKKQTLLDGVLSEENYTYDSQLRTLQPVSKTSLRSDGEVETTEISYAFSNGTSNTAMKDANIQKPLKVKHVVSGSSDSFIYDYTCQNGLCLLNQESHKRYGNTEVRMVYSYFSNGNLKECVKDGIEKTAFLWGYKGRLPIARIEGATYSEALTALPNGAPYQLSYSNTIPQMRASIEAAGYHVTEYRHRPLVGLSQETTPFGMSTSYEYDGQGRLNVIRDCNNHLTDRWTYTVSPTGSTYILHQSMLNSSQSNPVQQWQFHDALGRPSLQIDKGKNPGRTGCATYTNYNQLNLANRQWVPFHYPDFSMTVSESAVAEKSRTNLADNHPYSTTTYDVLGRPLYVTTPGDAWAARGKGHRVIYRGNTTADSVKRYALTSGSLSQSGNYQANTLHCQEQYDEDSIRNMVFTDLQGRIVLERKGTDADTYYIYDNYGELSYVLSPEYQNDADLAAYAYHYEYDERGRVIRKTLPGCEPVRYWYDKADRCIVMQDGVMRTLSVPKFRFFLYDRFSRPVVQGTCTGYSASFTTGQPVTLQYGSTSGTSIAPGYAQPAVTFYGKDIEQVYYYDDHSFLPRYTSDYPQMPAATTDTTSCISLLTGLMQKASNGETLLQSIYYDRKGRVSRTYESQLNKRLHIVQTNYNFWGGVSTQTETLKSHTGQQISKVQMTYDYYANTTLPRRTILRIYGTGSSYQTDTVQYLSYDNLGHVVSNNRGGTAGDMTYQYDLVHDRLKSMGSAGGFSQKLYRETTGTSVRYNGSLSAMTWKIPGEQYLRRYDYQYDNMNRLLRGTYTHSSAQTMASNLPMNDMLSLIPVPSADDDIPNMAAATSNGLNYYTEINTYDRNSNITGVQRYGKRNNQLYGMIDALTITRHGNQLKSVTDTSGQSLTYTGSSDFVDGSSEADEYSYNENGSLQEDQNRGITSISYDLHNNLHLITFDNGGRTEYVYSADGRKLRSSHKMTSSSAIISMADSTDYCSGWILENGLTSKYQFTGGYASLSATGTVSGWHYYLQDYMGNVRMVVNKNGDTEQVTHYYPYGGVIGDISTNQSLQKYKFEGKELDRTFGLDNYDIEARQYFAMAPMWDRVDPLAEKYYGISPYAYCAGDPVNLIDQTGESTQVVMMDSLRYMVLDGVFDDDNNIYVVAYGENGELERTGQIIGESATLWSFYNSDTKSWETGSIIDLSDNTAASFMERIDNDRENLISYIDKGRNGGEYDIKSVGDAYRGMPAPMMGSATTIASARDLGNYGAGYKAGSKGLSVFMTFAGFSAYDCYKNKRLGIEPIGSRKPQWIGYKKGFGSYIKKVFAYE